MNNYTELERQLILERAQRDARLSVFMQAMATIAKRGEKDALFAQTVVKMADAASLNVRWEDLTTAKPA